MFKAPKCYFMELWKMNIPKNRQSSLLLAKRTLKITTLSAHRSPLLNAPKSSSPNTPVKLKESVDEMDENAAALHTANNAVQALGKGFDVNFDTRLLYCKGVAGSKVVEIDEEHRRDLWLYDNLVVQNVSRDIENYQDPINRDSSGVCSYHE
ncbi:hypothetical protein Tco_1299944, partial [Tanacetum coccineum]